MTEYFRRAQVVPWYAAAIVIVIAGVGCLYFLVVAGPPVAGKNAPPDLRFLKAGLFLILGIGAVVWAIATTRRWATLAARGEYAPIIGLVVGRSPKGGAVPVAATYRVGNVEYKAKRDLPVSTAEAIRARPGEASVIYDLKNPATGYLLSPEIAALPDV